MTYVFVHGLGQNAASWQKTIEYLDMDTQQIVSPDLFSLLKGSEVDYHNLYKHFFDYCENINGPVQLCGLSLGAILSLNYAIDLPEKVNSLILIAAQYTMPRFLLSVQNGVFQMLPNSMFQKMGLPKKDVIQLTTSMKKLDFSQQLSDISCQTLILCGEKDKPNRKAAEQLSGRISGAKLEIIEQAGHEANADNPEVLAEIIKSFWNRTASSPI
ncbi:alpha/beta fold hydrolase [Oceanobacillus sojae]|uniref:alpha/beta fold hydrolase n=1 Tax=Oceanobacillus sojae TaxID=582851 RepID=UPI00098882F0|nr:alpha/beta fold hydrolase [Oceanobacillus sojae]MCT1903580.1 alpha/beta fold hydrolase [Oceanobacillus sojae]